MITLKDIRYVRLGTNDMDSAVQFATRILGLELDVQDRQAAYLRSDQRDHTLVYLNAPADDHTVGFELESLQQLLPLVGFFAGAGYGTLAAYLPELFPRAFGQPAPGSATTCPAC